MRIESSVTSISWIPSEAMSGPLRVPIDLGIGHYDDPLPDHIDDLEADRLEFLAYPISTSSHLPTSMGVSITSSCLPRLRQY